MQGGGGNRHFEVSQFSFEGWILGFSCGATGLGAGSQGAGTKEGLLGRRAEGGGKGTKQDGRA